MKLLLIDTCGRDGSLALADTALSPPVVATATLPGRLAAERLVPAIKALAAGPGLHSLDAIAVVHGPGSFTGIRVGVSAAKGLSEALNLPLIAISRLAVLAHLSPRNPQDPLDREASPRVHALLDAGRGEFYYGEFAAAICLRESLLTRDRVLAAVAVAAPATVVACELAVAQSLTAFAPRLVSEPTAADALPLALRRIREQSFDDPALLDANYLRRSDAELFARPQPSRTALQTTAPEIGGPKTPAR